MEWCVSWADLCHREHVFLSTSVKYGKTRAVVMVMCLTSSILNKLLTVSPMTIVKVIRCRRNVPGIFKLSCASLNAHQILVHGLWRFVFSLWFALTWLSFTNRLVLLVNMQYFCDTTYQYCDNLYSEWMSLMQRLH